MGKTMAVTPMNPRQANNREYGKAGPGQIGSRLSAPRSPPPPMDLFLRESIQRGARNVGEPEAKWQGGRGQVTIKTSSAI